MTQQIHKLSIFEKIGYAFGDGASNLIWMMFIYFQLNFYTDVYGLAASALATMLLVTRTWDMFIDVFIGMTADRTKTRWGKFRPYLLWMALPFGIISVLAFTTPSLAPFGKLIYAYVTLSLMMVVYSAIKFHRFADGRDFPGFPRADQPVFLAVHLRVSWAAWWCSTPLAAGRDFGKGNQALGYQLTIAAFAVAAVALFWSLSRPRASAFSRWWNRRHRGPGICAIFWRTRLGWCCARWAFSGFLRLPFAAPLSAIISSITAAIGGGARSCWLGSVMSVLGTFLIQYVTPFTGRKNAFIGLMLVATVTLVAFLLGPAGSALASVRV